jgi:7,8-dihydropterin-6-yl-methyl-4-(beta-D-ribofuranosyl)aminobenzene 5'-phosphate synthase
MTFLTENHPGPDCSAEHGLSILIEADEQILFDSGQSRLFLENAARLNISLEKVRKIVLSHGHYDHGNGLAFLSNKELICHSACFTRRYRQKNKSYIGLSFNEEKARKKFNLTLSDKPLTISPTVTFLGTVPRINDFEAQNTTFLLEDGTLDEVIDDSGLVIETAAGLIIISGCAHSGICNIIEHARKVTKQKQVRAVIGGFHLKKNDPAILPTIDFFRTLDSAKFWPCHCVDEEVIELLHAEINCESVYCGKEIVFHG